MSDCVVLSLDWLLHLLHGVQQCHVTAMQAK